jgi:hypothetical protein
LRLEEGPLLYLAARGEDVRVTGAFAGVSRLPDLKRMRGNRVIATYDVLLLDGPRRLLQAKAP